MVRAPPPEPSERYQRSLDAYIRASTENDVVSRCLTDVLLSLISSRPLDKGLPLRWLDIGAGDGRKTLDAFSQLTAQSIDPDARLIEATLLDRDGRFGDRDCGRHGIGSVKRLTGAWPSVSLDGDRFDLVTIMHAAYQFEGTKTAGPVKAVSAVLKVLADEGKLIIVHESKKSVFQALKRKLYPGIDATLINENGLRASLKESGLEIVFSCCLEQHADLDDSMLDIASEAFPWFLFESATSSCDAVDDAVAVATADWLRAELGGQTKIRVDDCVLIAQRRLPIR